MAPLSFQPPSTGRRFQFDARHVGTVIGLGHRHGAQGFADGQLRQPVLFLLLGAALEQGPGENLGAGDQAARGAQGAPGQLLGDHDHAQGVLLVILLQAAVAFGDGQAEHAHFLQRIEDGVGDDEVVAMHILGQGLHHLIREFVKGVAHHGVALFQQVRAQVGAALHYLQADGGDIGCAQLARQECGVVSKHRGDVRAGQLEVRQAGLQARAAGAGHLGAEQGAKAAGEVVGAGAGVIKHEAGGAALGPAQGQFI